MTSVRQKNSPTILRVSCIQSVIRTTTSAAICYNISELTRVISFLGENINYFRKKHQVFQTVTAGTDTGATDYRPTLRLLSYLRRLTHLTRWNGHGNCRQLCNPFSTVISTYTCSLVRYYSGDWETNVYRRRHPVRSRLRQHGTSMWWCRHRDKTSSRTYTGTWRCCCTSSTWLTELRCRYRLVDRSQ